LRLLELKPQPDVSSPNTVPIQLPPTPISEAPSTERRAKIDVALEDRFSWIFVIFLLALAAVQCSLHYARRTEVVDDLNEEAADYLDSELEQLAEAIRSDRVALSEVSPRSSKTHGSELACALVLATCALFGALLVLGNEPARRDFWTSMNGNFLSDTFAASILVLVAFASAQWWRWTRAKRQVLVTIGDVRLARHNELHDEIKRERIRLAGLIDTIATAELTLIRPRLWGRWSYDKIDMMFQPIKKVLVERAIRSTPFESPYTTGSLARLRHEKLHLDKENARLQQYRAVKDATEFARLLAKDAFSGSSTPRLDADLRDYIERAATAAALSHIAEVEECLSPLFPTASLEHEEIR
jgi:hypothetical protein